MLDTEPQEQEVEVVANEQEVQQEDHEQVEERQVPVSAIQKERKKRQEAELEKHKAQIELQYYREQMQQKVAVPAEDDSQYESATRADLNKSVDRIKREAIQEFEERNWSRSNPEKSALVDQKLETFLKQRPHLRDAIANAPNRYEEAYLLMEAFTPKVAARLPERREAPGAPTSVPKGASANKVMDVMSMTDKEYIEWRNTKRRR